ncbi:MAG: SET domain-containing protein [Salinimicrobium sp.]
MMHPDTELRFINDELGYGVVATKFIPMGTITWVQDELDQVLEPSQVERMRPEVQKLVDKYSFRNNRGDLVLCWDLAKYVNHSFNSNCLSTAYDFELAVRDIQPGEELTDDYGYLNVSEPFVPRDEGTARKTVFPDDLLHYHREWDEQLAKAFNSFEKIAQPLKQLVAQQHLQRLEELLQKQMPVDSILSLYYRENLQD